MKRTTDLPQPQTLEELMAVANRQVRNIIHNLADCEDCQDCSESELFIYRNQGEAWLELANDIRDMIDRKL
jgi:hypothetical protein